MATILFINILHNFCTLHMHKKFNILCINLCEHLCIFIYLVAATFWG